MDTVTGLSIVLACAAAGLGYGFWARQSVLAAPAGNARMQEIAAAIQEGAKAFLDRQYKTIAVVAVFVALIVAAAFQSWV
ncbi:MAG: sodium-translocating pyrophosphatase, partial [Alphaproteobacteria bacterium]|nr:sodium-translocating pyrophosphatase [Alphaproteobacteria bacterium]